MSCTLVGTRRLEHGGTAKALANVTSTKKYLNFNYNFTFLGTPFYRVWYMLDVGVWRVAQLIPYDKYFIGSLDE